MDCSTVGKNLDVIGLLVALFAKICKKDIPDCVEQYKFFVIIHITGFTISLAEFLIVALTERIDYFGGPHVLTFAIAAIMELHGLINSHSIMQLLLLQRSFTIDER